MRTFVILVFGMAGIAAAAAGALVPSCAKDDRQEARGAAPALSAMTFLDDWPLLAILVCGVFVVGAVILIKLL